MISGKEINQRQNSIEMRELNLTAGASYDYAEKINNTSWLICLMTIVISLCSNLISPTLSIGISFIADLAQATLIFYKDKYIKQAASLRNYFDNYVLKLSNRAYTKSEIQKIFETVNLYISKHKEKAEIKISNTGENSPPGFRDWYTDIETLNGNAAIFECQDQNIWWEEKLAYKKCILSIILPIVLVTALITFLLVNSLFVWLWSLSSLYIKLGEVVYINIKYLQLTYKILGVKSILEVDPSDSGIQILQNMIEERRGMSTVGISFLHNKLASRLTTRRHQFQEF